MSIVSAMKSIFSVHVPWIICKFKGLASRARRSMPVKFETFVFYLENVYNSNMILYVEDNSEDIIVSSVPPMVVRMFCRTERDFIFRFFFFLI